MAVVWLTYAWNDNEHRDVDFIAQQLQRAGLTVRLDRWDIRAGLDLWSQIERFITHPNECNAWILYATHNSLGSGPCMKEYLYARDRAVASRGNDFPVVALFASHPDRTLLSPSIRSRLYVSMTDPDWKERIKSPVESRGLQLNQGEVSVYEVRVHPLDLGEQHYAIEFRPRAGTWSPFFVAIPLGEKEVVGPRFSYGPRNQPIIRSGPISYAPAISKCICSG